MKLSVPIHVLKRRARLLAREADIPLYRALDIIAKKEGMASWSHLAARMSQAPDTRALLTEIGPAGLVLLAARPGQGKTMLGLELALEAIAHSRDSTFFTLEYTEGETRERADRLSNASHLQKLEIVASDDIAATSIVEHLKHKNKATFAVVDYLQLLDQKRTNPDLDEQVAALRAFALESNSLIVVLSQVDRNFDATSKALPDATDVRLPNPVDLAAFSKLCFLHDGRIAVSTA